MRFTPVIVFVAFSLVPCLAFRVRISGMKNSSGASIQTASQGECDGAYSIPNYLFTEYDRGQAWKLGIPQGAEVTIKRVDGSMNQWLIGQKGIVVADKDGDALVPDYLDSYRGEVCFFSGYVYFPGIPNGNLGRKNRWMYKGSHGADVYGLSFQKFQVKDVSIEPKFLEHYLDKGYTLLGPQLDVGFTREIILDVLRPVEKEEDTVVSPQLQHDVEEMIPSIPEIQHTDVVSTVGPRLEIKPEILLEAAELMPDSELLKPIQPIIEAKLEAAISTQDSKVVERVQLQPLLHVIDIGELAVPDEIILDSIVRTIALSPESPKDLPKSGKKVGQACHAATMEDVKECCKAVTKKFWIIDCCWHACYKLSPDEQGVCMLGCKDGRVD